MERKSLLRGIVRALILATVASTGLIMAAHRAAAFISQADGTVVPQTSRMQACLDRPVTGESMAGAVDAVDDAQELPEAFRPVEDPIGSGIYTVTFQMIGEGAGYRNLLGFYYVDEDPTDPANLHMVFDCRPGGTCGCPCNPNNMRSSDGSPTSHTVTIDFGLRADFMPGRAVGFWLRTPDRITGGTDDNHCGGPTVANQNHRTYFTSKSLNDDGDYVHYLIYRSATRVNTYYFGFEDLWRGGDNDFEDALVRVEGLVPLCDPQPEVCNGVDDDCDLAVDEGVTRPCSTACGAGTETCTMGSWGMCSAPTTSPETCNNLDDNCNGRIDEGLSQACSTACGSGIEICRAGSWADCNAPTPGIERCNNADDDCDGAIDEGISRRCTTACGSGTERCMAGMYSGCNAPTPTEETCNAVDDDCDGLTDEGLRRDCTTACGTGIETCISGRYVGCTAPSPGAEACNNIDDDCDGMTDEDLSRTCSTACGNGTETCVAGSFVGCDAPLPGVEICNAEDDDCDGIVDEDIAGTGERCIPNPAGGYDLIGDGTPDGEICLPGRVRCIAGELRCIGASSASPEICNCVDDDCDGEIDEDVDGSLCPGGICNECMCASPCASEEFPCPPGRICDTTLRDPASGVIGYCVEGMCAGVTCGDEEICDPLTGMCDNLCEGRNCVDGFVCVRGSCVEDNCYGRGCPTGERCLAGVCEDDPCAGVSCGDAEFCRSGDCVAACTTACADNESCQDGVCMPAPCGGRCADTESCIEGACVLNDCQPGCGRRRICRGDACVDDPCARIECPGGTQCSDGNCAAPAGPTPPQARFGLATGGGGCVCSTPGTSPGQAPSMAGILVLLGLLGLALVRRSRGRPTRGRPSAPVRPWMALMVCGTLLLATGCQVDAFCFDNCDEAVDAGPVRPDAHVSVDGCVVRGAEECNGVDDDCDGEIDEDFDTATNPLHCGGCDQPCNLPHAFPSCEAGECSIGSCEIGHHDRNETPSDGCEYECQVTGDEICDERDNDCDGLVDEDFDTATDLANCGECGNVCSFNNAATTCSAGECHMGACNAGFVNLNGREDDGCEYRCTPTGAETCNLVDDDCDGDVDEGFNLGTDPANCGTCGHACDYLNAAGRCMDGVCGMGPCHADFVDLDGDPATGCEYGCTVTGTIDLCNGFDDDCDGAFDEEDPAVGTPCGSNRGECQRGVRGCQLGALVCVGGRTPTPEQCNDLDDDCDGETDESTMADPIPGTGVLCGESNVGACRYGAVICGAGGVLTCGGTYAGPSAELCNGIDDDCDNTVDDTPRPPTGTPPSCVETRGVCAGRSPICTGVTGWRCELPTTYQTTESICDGLDNDCDGGRDEGCLVAAPASDVRIDTGDAAGANNSVQPTIDGDGNNYLYVAWIDRRNDPARIYYNRSTNGGNAWLGAAQLLDGGGGAAIGPRFGVTGATGRNVSVLWADFQGRGSYREVDTRRSTDGLGTFAGADFRVNPGQNTDSFNVDVAVSGNRVFVTYENFVTPRERHIFFARSNDAGATFDAPLRVDHGSGAAFVASTPKIAASGSDVYVVWRDNRNGGLDVFLNRSTNNGGSFAGTDTRLDVGDPAGSAASFAPQIAAEGSNVYAVWVDQRGGASFDIYINRSTDRGATWRPSARNLDADPIAHDSGQPRIIAPRPNTVVVAWVDYRYGFSDVLVSQSDNAAGTFSAPARMDTGTAPGTATSFDLALAGEGDLVATAWADDRSGLFDLYANFSLDGGQTWQPNDTRLDSTAMPGSSDSVSPAIYVAGGRAHVVWVDYRSQTSGAGDIYYRRLQ